MNTKVFRSASLTLVRLALAMVATSGTLVSQAATSLPAGTQRYLVESKSAGEYDALRADVVRAGGQVLRELRQVNLMVVNLPALSRAQVLFDQSTHMRAKAKDGIRRLIQPSKQRDLWGAPFSTSPHQTRIQVDGSQVVTPAVAGLAAVTPDPAYDLPGLLWNLDRIHAPAAWNDPTIGTGIDSVRVAVADTGLDYTHSELNNDKVEGVEDFTSLEGPTPICKAISVPPTDDADLAAFYGVNADLDFNGHGTWIGGNISANLDGTGINGIAPDIKLWSFKISQWCGGAYDSEILAAFLAAADHSPRIDVVSISFGGYLDKKDPLQLATYNQYVRVVDYAKTKGVVIVAAAGNDHVRVGTGGQVLNHGSLTTPGADPVDLFGLFEIPGGIPGVVMVSSTGNAVNATSALCVDPPDTDLQGDPTCKPSSDKHKPFGVGKQNQLAYYSNYGPRIDVAGPGGARKFNLPNYDRGGTVGYPNTFNIPAEGTNAWEDFSITSNYAQEIPCVIFTGFEPDLYDDQCYSTIQGTSMATPHASAVLALIASSRPDVRYVPDALIYLLKSSAQKLTVNSTPPLSSSDKTAGDLSGVLCAKGYCHLGGTAISVLEAFGAGLVEAAPPAP